MRALSIFSLFLFACGLVEAQDYNPNKPWESQVPRRPQTTTPPPGPAQKTRSLSGGYATDGRNETNADVIKLITVGLLEGYSIRRVKAFNDRVHLTRYRRSYWLGTRYYELDNFYYLATRDTCLYRMNATERKDLEYEDGELITEIVYQCQRYAQFCCGLDCCNIHNKREAPFAEKNATTRIGNFLTLFMAVLLVAQKAYASCR